jgi:hypothetical protein
MRDDKNHHGVTPFWSQRWSAHHKSVFLRALDCGGLDATRLRCRLTSRSKKEKSQRIGDRKSLFQGLPIAGVVDAVKANFVPISGDMKAGTATVRHRGGRLDGGFAAKWTSGALCRSRSARKAISQPDRRQAAPMKPARGPSSDGVLVVDVDRPFISGPAVVAILDENRPVFGRFDFSLPRLGSLFPQAQMAADARYDVRFMDQAYDLHFAAASGTTERVHLPNFHYELPPGLGRRPAWLMAGHIEHGRLGMALGGRRLITGPEDPSLDSFSSTSA